MTTLMLANSKRLGEFCGFYGNSTLNAETRFTLMMLIVASWDDALQDRAATDRDVGDVGLNARIKRLLGWGLCCTCIRFTCGLCSARPIQKCVRCDADIEAYLG